MIDNVGKEIVAAEEDRSDLSAARRRFHEAISEGVWTERCDCLAADLVVAMMREGLDRAAVIRELRSAGVAKREAFRYWKLAGEMGLGTGQQGRMLRFGVWTTPDCFSPGPSAGLRGRGHMQVQDGCASVCLRVRLALWVRIAWRTCLTASGLAIVYAWIALVGQRPSSGLLQAVGTVVGLFSIGLLSWRVGWQRLEFDFSAGHHEVRVNELEGVVSFLLENGTWLNLHVPHDRRGAVHDSAGRHYLMQLLAQELAPVDRTT